MGNYKMCLCNALIKTPYCGKDNCKERRLPINNWMIGIAEQVAKRSSWPGTKVGCVVAKDGRIVSTGYNGTPRGWRGPENREHKKLFCHAEENAIVNAARYGISLEGCIFYLTISPCLQCARMMVNVGATIVVYKEIWDEHETTIDNLFTSLNIGFEQLST